MLTVHTTVQRELWRHARIKAHSGRTQVWNLAGVTPEGCEVLERFTQQMNLKLKHAFGQDQRCRWSNMHTHFAHSVGSRRVCASTIGDEVEGTRRFALENPKCGRSAVRLGIIVPLRLRSSNYK